MRFSISSFLGGIVIVPIAGALIGLGVLHSGLIPANADAKPGNLERWMAKTSLNATLAREATATPPPMLETDAALTDGAKLYAADCAVCHGVQHGEKSNIAQGLYQHPPQFGNHGVSDDPVDKTYWKIEHGIRLTGMPAFSATLTDKQKWEVAFFLKDMDALPPHAKAAWRQMRVPGQ